ncbi:hypothetical protein [Alcanivorax sp. 1008]|uniref:hypothetical protein n=1 Tax=Alcanivorax sp. 1008 TaxID=2816853 RepID=UPI001DC47E2D|nr:hypothetical protein [Alcanivorax sp. 1008]MCC1497219.1 hypothetical protein [Alcanivorax sp. 1008]
MTSEPLKTVSDLVTEAHARIQQQHADINPVVGVRRGMREKGIPADALTIDCLRTGKRIVLILHDQQPGELIYQFTLKDQDTDAPYQQLPMSNLRADLLYEWMRDYFVAQT